MTEVDCPYCDYENTVPYEPHGKSGGYNHSVECSNCQKSFVYRTGFLEELAN